uniref:Uncharacterized protein n=1 Tax=Quercus lobata TaxID=97700 RepID=A0A7N2KPM9_QUELO
MSVLWLVPQFSLLGLMDGLASDGLHEFFYDHVATLMRSYGPSFSDCVLGFGNFISMPFVLPCRSWFKHSINTSHLDSDDSLSTWEMHRSVSFPMRRRYVAYAAAATATESQPTKSFSFPLRSISLRLKDKKVGESAANVDSPEHMQEPLLQSHASTEAEEGLLPDDKPAESHHD